jgi:hypothetical protein
MSFDRSSCYSFLLFLLQTWIHSSKDDVLSRQCLLTRRVNRLTWGKRKRHTNSICREESPFYLFSSFWVSLSFDVVDSGWECSAWPSIDSLPKNPSVSLFQECCLSTHVMSVFPSFHPETWSAHEFKHPLLLSSNMEWLLSCSSLYSCVVFLMTTWF